MSRSTQSKLVVIVAGVAGVAILAALLLFFYSRVVGQGSAADVVADALPESVVAVVWSVSIDDALALVEAAKVNAAALDNMGAGYSKVIDRLGFDPLQATALQELGIDTAGTPTFALAPGLRSRGLGVVYVPMLSGKSAVDALGKILDKVGDGAPEVVSADEDGHRVGWVQDRQVDYETLKERACQHAIKVIKESGMMAVEDLTPSIEEEVTSGCREAFSGMSAQVAAEAAACILDSHDMERFEFCVEDARRDEDSAPGGMQQVQGNKALRGAVVEVSGGALVVFPIDPRRRHQEAVEDEIRAFVGTIVDESVPRLSSLDGYEEALADSGEVLVGLYVNPAGLRQMMAVEEDLLPLASALTEIAGVGAFVKEEGNSLVAVVQTVVTEKSPKVILQERDQKVLEYVPGSPLMGFHFAVDAESVIKQVERGVALDPRTWRHYQEGKGEAQEALHLPGVEIYQVWNGEMGLFVGDLAPSPEFVVRSLVGFAGLKDVDKLKMALDALVVMADGHMVPDKVGDAQAWRISVEGMTMGIMIHEGRLWYAGDWSALTKIQQGEAGGLLEGERNERIAAVMEEDMSFVSFFDLKKPVTLLQATMGRGDEEVQQLVLPLLNKLDYLTYTGRQDGRVSTACATLYLEGQGFTAILTEALASQFVQSFDQYARKAKTAEAIDQLDKIYKGAADYFSTPRVSMDGEKLDCQFPQSVGLSPATTCCGSNGGPDADGDGRCDFQMEAWVMPTWSALRFQLNDPHYCVYSFDSSGTGSNAQFTANAHCDLDCDGVFSTFQRYGKADPSSSQWECSTTGAAGFYVENETE